MNMYDQIRQYIPCPMPLSRNSANEYQYSIWSVLVVQVWHGGGEDLRRWNSTLLGEVIGN